MMGRIYANPEFMSFYNRKNIEAFDLAEPALRHFAQSKGAIPVLDNKFYDTEVQLPESCLWMMRAFEPGKKFEKKNSSFAGEFFKRAVVKYQYRSLDITFQLKTNPPSDRGHQSEPLLLTVKAEIPDSGDIIIFYYARGERKRLWQTSDVYPKPKKWLTDNFVFKPMGEIWESMAGKKIPTLVRRHFGRHNASLTSNDKGWGDKFATNLELENTVRLIPELIDFNLGVGSFRNLDTSPCLHINAEGTLRREDIYINIAKLAELCLDLIISTTPG